MRANGTGVVRFTTGPAYDREPAWSPDGASIAYAGVVGGDFDIRVKAIGGSSAVTLTTSPANDYDPAWQPLPR